MAPRQVLSLIKKYYEKGEKGKKNNLFFTHYFILKRMNGD